MRTIETAPPRELPNTALPLFTIPDAAEVLGVSVNYLYERIRDARIASVNLGTDTKPKLRIRADTLQHFIQKLTSDGDVA